MRTHHHPFPRLAGRAAIAVLTAVALLPLAGPAAAQAAAASAPAPGNPPPRVMTPEAKRDSATAPGTLRPERPTVPQLTVPMQVPPPPPASAPAGALPPNPAASAGGVSDAVARCEAKTSAVERAQCRRDLAQQQGPAAPAKR